MKIFSHVNNTKIDHMDYKIEITKVLGLDKKIKRITAKSSILSDYELKATVGHTIIKFTSRISSCFA
ncbi:hypothetical protein CE11_00015 [Megavirus courdo11]|uniref:Uncharacterized protein n=1 Tax=Megavirus courdo11 TaxID=1128140 RepID=K7YUV8_9VIRU|nr:hypothetical protein CE11_00015 [Megavirus courdo11]